MSLSPFSPKYCQIFRPCAISWHFHALTASCTPRTSILVGISTPLRSMLRFLPFLIYENMFFWLRLELFTVLPVFHQTVKAGCILQGCIHFFSLSCWTVFALASAMTPSFKAAPPFASPSAFSLPSVTNFSKCDISVFSFFVRCALTCSTSTTISLAARRCNSSQIF